MAFSPRRAGMARRLPVPLWPSQDEALWSWLLRLSCFYELSVSDFLLWIGMEARSGRTLSFSDEPSDELVARLSTASGLPPEAIRAMGFRNPCDPDSAAFQDGHRYCLHCLKRDRDRGRHDALRRSWGLSRVTFCALHGSPLVDHCPTCPTSGTAFVYDDGMIRLACGVCRTVVDTARIPDDETLFARSLTIPPDEDAGPITRQLLQAVRAYEEVLLAALVEGIAPDSPFPPTPALFKAALSYTAYSLPLIPLWDPTLAWVPYFSTALRNRGLDARRAQHAFEMIVLTNGGAMPTLYPDFRSWTGKRERFQAFCNVGGLYHMANRFNRTVLQGYTDDLDPRLASELELAVTSQRLKLGWCGPLEPDRADFVKDCTGPRTPTPRGDTNWAADEATRSAASRQAETSEVWRDVATTQADDPPFPPTVASLAPSGQPAPPPCVAETRTSSRPPRPASSAWHEAGAAKARVRKGTTSPPQWTEADNKAAPHDPAHSPRETLLEPAGLVSTRYSREALQAILDQERRRRPEAFCTPAGRLRQIQRIAREIVDGARAVQINQER